ncbi:hypothetical protein LOH54_08565 [Sulfurimonas sp. HSL-3221]|uniref:hypothetical protein n=1 Tax=Sulfurimonadaceae TaxID=2771471 RepID=UPI001E57AA0F|nr:hypothetical protein [Sulfurimonas sp. HSL-3221]UFS61715.1 hypothetical protein LOH54_08565 [Sulfurimonas sp. HSL-3221]
MNAGLLRWRIAQSFLGAYALLLIYALLFHPALGLDLFWNLLIPAAPMILFLSIGTWRNVCPLATLSLLPKHAGASKRRKPGRIQHEWLRLSAVAVLLTVIPLRHAVFDLNAAATLSLLAGTGIAAAAAGWFFDGKSGWCSGLCPVFPAEKIYATDNCAPPTNAHCRVCTHCTAPCPDRTPGAAVAAGRGSRIAQLTSFALAGFFPGFVYGWFFVPDMHNAVDAASLFAVYTPGLFFGALSALVYLFLRLKLPGNALHLLSAASTVSIYYGFRLPALFGFGLQPGDGVLIDMSPLLPPAAIHWCTAGLTLFFFYRAYRALGRKQAWLHAPVSYQRDHNHRKR